MIRNIGIDDKGIRQQKCRRYHPKRIVGFGTRPDGVMNCIPPPESVIRGDINLGKVI